MHRMHIHTHVRMHTHTHTHTHARAASSIASPPPHCRLPVRSPRARCSPFGRNLRVLIPLEVSMAALTEPNAQDRAGMDVTAPVACRARTATYVLVSACTETHQALSSGPSTRSHPGLCISPSATPGAASWENTSKTVRHNCTLYKSTHTRTCTHTCTHTLEYTFFHCGGKLESRLQNRTEPSVEQVAKQFGGK